MELRHLRYFIAVAEELSFTRAAERLGIKQPPLSLQIRQLEKELGAPLFRRLTRGVELTGSGKLLLEEARTILDQVDQTKTDVKRRARGEIGQISLGAAGGCYFHPLIGIIMSQFSKSYPEVVLSPEENHTPMLIAKVLAGTIDAAFVRSSSADCDGLAVEPIAEEDTLVVLPASSELRHASSVPLSALAGEKFVLPPPRMNVGFYKSVLDSCQRAGFKPIMGQQAPGTIAVIPMVAAGCGVSIVPQSLSRLRLKGVTYLPIKGPRPTVSMNLASRPNDHSAPVRNLISLVRRVVRATIPVRQSA